jgi:hypothetical protein
MLNPAAWRRFCTSGESLTISNPSDSVSSLLPSAILMQDTTRFVRGASLQKAQQAFIYLSICMEESAHGTYKPVMGSRRTFRMGENWVSLGEAVMFSISYTRETWGMRRRESGIRKQGV